MSTEKQRDLNYLSLNRDAVVWFAGTESWHYGEIPNPPILRPQTPKAWESILKCSDRHDTRLFGLEVSQGKENALDINNKSSGLTFGGEWGVEGEGGEQIITVKGGSWGIKLEGKIHSRGSRADLVVGLWSDQSTETSHHLDFSKLEHATGRPLTVILCRVDSPFSAALGKPSEIKLPPGAKVLFWKSIGAQLGWWVKWAAVKMGFYK